MQRRDLEYKRILFISIILLFSRVLFATNQNQFTLKAFIGIGQAPKEAPLVIRDLDINSPKSVRFTQDGRKFYINSLEGGMTAVYSWPELTKLKTINHKFNVENQYLFQNETTVFNYPYYIENKQKNPNIFMGKPVESELTPDGRWLLIPYYRRDFDTYGQSPGALAIIDTQTDEIVRVMPTGPIPKYVSTSPDGRYIAIIHWGDNTVGIIDSSSANPRDYHYITHLTVENKLSQSNLAQTDRDKTCGFCLRGAVFTPDSRYLLVARMGKGGIAGFDIQNEKYLGSIMNIQSTPRHLVVSSDKENLFVSSNFNGYVSKGNLDTIIQSLINADGKRIPGPKWQEVYVGQGARTIDLSPDGKTLYAAVNLTTELVSLNADTMKIESRTKIAPFPVGLATSPDGSAIILTSQGRAGKGGGNAVTIIEVDNKNSRESTDKTNDYPQALTTSEASHLP